jgi:hypothetical protein
MSSPVVALISLSFVCIGLGLYTGALTDVFESPPSRETAKAVARDLLTHNGSRTTVSPQDLHSVRPPVRYQLNLTLRVQHTAWAVGPQPPSSGVDIHSQPVGVAHHDGRVVWGEVTVQVWR